MAIDRQGTGFTVLRIFIGTFFIFLGLGKLSWFANPSILGALLNTWHHAAASGSISARYLERVAIPYTSVFARLVPLGEMSCGLAMVLGLWTPFFAFVAFLMVLNFHVAGGSLFRYGFLTDGTGLPVLGATLALALGGVRLPFSLRK